MRYGGGLEGDTREVVVENGGRVKMGMKVGAREAIKGD
jgi:hypothetical protein